VEADGETVDRQSFLSLVIPSEGAIRFCGWRTAVEEPAVFGHPVLQNSRFLDFADRPHQADNAAALEMTEVNVISGATLLRIPSVSHESNVRAGQRG